MLLNLPFTSMGARELNVSIFETIYYAALDASCRLAEAYGPYLSFAGSPASRGILQVDMWGCRPSDRHDFAALRARIARFGLRNSVVTALMPTASTSKLLGNFESFEPYTRYHLLSSVASSLICRLHSNAIVMRTGSGDYPLICPHLVRALCSRGLWTEDVRMYLQRSRGSSWLLPLLLAREANVPLYRLFAAMPRHSLRAESCVSYSVGLRSYRPHRHGRRSCPLHRPVSVAYTWNSPADFGSHGSYSVPFSPIRFHLSLFSSHLDRTTEGAHASCLACRVEDRSILSAHSPSSLYGVS